MFLSVNVPKLLLLAGVDRLDKELMVGQMQGKFQMQVLPQCGHAVHGNKYILIINYCNHALIDVVKKFLMLFQLWYIRL